MKTLIIAAITASLLIAGCDRSMSNTPTSKKNTTVAVDEPAAQVIPKDIKADSVQVSYANNTVILGAIGGQPFASFGGNGAVPKLIALGPVKVWIFKEVDPEYQEFMRDEYGVELGGAYLETGPDQFEFIRLVDISLSDEELAKLFGIE